MMGMMTISKKPQSHNWRKQCPLILDCLELIGTGEMPGSDMIIDFLAKDKDPFVRAMADGFKAPPPASRLAATRLGK